MSPSLAYRKPMPCTCARLYSAAEKLLKSEDYFDYLHGRVMKISLRDDVLRTRLYDRDNGYGAAHAAIKHLLPTE